MQQMQAILERIAARRAELGLSEAAVAAKGGSRDLIRNWRRALEKGQTISARYDSLAAIARALDVSEDWLIMGKGEAKAKSGPPRQPGMADAATPFVFAQEETRPGDPQTALRSLFGAAVSSPGLFRIHVDQAAFGLAAGDVALVDLARLPEPGEIAIVSIYDDDTATATWMLCLYAPPMLFAGQLGPNAARFRVDDPGVTVRHPVVGSMRGIPETQT
jgi:transcriptional regulator with XRE-family HTH domain